MQGKMDAIVAVCVPHKIRKKGGCVRFQWGCFCFCFEYHRFDLGVIALLFSPFPHMAKAE
jgi:hypothetical protein